MAQRKALKHEERIVWEEDIARLDYVRESVARNRWPMRRRGPLRSPGRRVGYAELSDDAPAPVIDYGRRVFWLRAHDRDSDPDGTYQTGAPAEAVDPRTVAPGVPGELTERAWGAPLDAEEGQRHGHV